MNFINVGYGNMVAVERIVTLASPDSAPIKRLIQDAKDAGRVIDVSCGRKTRAVLVLDSDHVVLSALQTDTVAARLLDRSAADGTEEQESDASLSKED